MAVLDNLKESNGLLGLRVIIYTGSIEIENLSVKHFFRRTDIPNPVQEFFPVQSASTTFEPSVIQGKSFDDILMETDGRPLAKACANDGMDAVAHGNDHVQVVT